MKGTSRKDRGAGHISNMHHIDSLDSFSLFGTNYFSQVWERVCGEVIGNQLHDTLGSLQLPVPLNDVYAPTDTLISLIEKPKWYSSEFIDGSFVKASQDTLIPDIVSVYVCDGSACFSIFDAKYYMLVMERDEELRGCPGIGDITKQYLYQLAFKAFTEKHLLKKVRNCFLMPTEGSRIVNKGHVCLEILNDVGLQNIQVRLLPAHDIYALCLAGHKLDIALLNL